MTNFARCCVRRAEITRLHRTIISLRFPGVRLCVLFSLLLLVDVRAAVRDESTSGASSGEPACQLTEHPLFRLGDAAAPFGWSTIIGDFNTDGRPDVAVADHAGRRTGRYEYRLEFRLSGGHSHLVTFVSVHDAVTIRAVDVDRDDDLDVIIGVPFSGETIGVWINDGHGHFSAGSTRQAPVELGVVDGVQAGDSARSFAIWNSADRRSIACRLSALRSPPALMRAGLTCSGASFLRPGSPVTDANPRAPPTTGLSAFS
jgi:hypothetical protein